MRIAVFSDVHANMPALEAVFEDMKSQAPDAVYCLGDLVNQNVWNNEVVDLLRARHIPCIMGNHDSGIGNEKKRFRFSYTSPEQLSWGLEAIAYTLQQITPENKAFLRSLPLQKRLIFRFNSTQVNILLVHASPRSPDEYIYEYLPDKELGRIMLEAGADVLLTGHTHHAFSRVLHLKGKERPGYCQVVSVGSVGCPKDNYWQACYALLDIDESKNLRYDPTAVTISFRRVEYDLNKVIKAIQRSGLSLYYAARLLK